MLLFWRFDGEKNICVNDAPPGLYTLSLQMHSKPAENPPKCADSPPSANNSGSSSVAPQTIFSAADQVQAEDASFAKAQAASQAAAEKPPTG
jgi:hypothetical protein